MWKILIAEFSYNKSILITAVFAYILFVIAFIVCSMISSRLIKYNHVMLATLIPGMVASISMLYSKNIDKRDRLLTILPVMPYRIACAHIVFAVILWISLVILFWMIPSVLHIVEINRSIVLVMIYLNGSFLLMNALYFIIVDMKHCFTRKKILLNLFTDELLMIIFVPCIILLWFCVFGMPYGFIFGLFEPLRLYMQPIVISPLGVVVLNLLALCLSFLSVELFVHRKSYLE